LIPKIIFIANTAAHVSEMIDKHSIDGGYWLSPIDDGRILVAAYPRHHSTRFALAEEEGIVVMPGSHDPEPIGDIHKHLDHIGAQPYHTARHVHLRLAERHGDVFHPDV
jgi:hypothetical protein